MADPDDDDYIEEDDFESMVDAYFTEIYSELSERGVEEDRQPTTLQVLSHVMECVDEARLKAWMAAYAGVEGKVKDK